MANYNVGKINLEIDTIDKNSVSKIKKIVSGLNEMTKLDKGVMETFKSINQLANGLVKIQKIKLNDLNKQFTKISEETKNLNKNLNDIKEPKFKETAQALNRLSNAFKKMNELKNIDFRGIYNSFNSLNRILEPFLSKLNQSKEALVAMSNILTSLRANKLVKANGELDKAKQKIESARNTTKKIKEDTDSINNNFTKIISIGKIYWFLNYTKQLARGLANIVNTAIDFEETLNKFQVSMAEYSKEATAYATNLANAFNLSRESIMDYMSTFNSMLKSMGNLSTSQAYNLSKTLTELALDYSSLFNVSVDRAMTSFQAMLSRQIRSIRSVSGIDVSDNTIYQYYQELGGQKSIRQLSQIEKRLLGIYALEKQMDKLGAIGDLNKTINSSSNMLKQLQQTWKETFVSMGNIALKFFKPVIQWALSLSLVIKDVMSAWATAIGAVTEEYNNNDFMSIFNDEVETAIDNVNELNGLLSFDKFEALQTGTTTENSDEVEKIAEAIKKLNTDLFNITSQARQQADNVLKWLGFIKEPIGEIDKTTGEIIEETKTYVWVLKDGYTNLDKIKTLVTTLFTIGIVKGITSIISKISLMNASLGTTVTISKLLNVALGSLIIFQIVNLIQNFDKMDTQTKILNISLTALTVSFLTFKKVLENKEALERAFKSIISWFEKMIITGQAVKINMAIGLGAVFASVITIMQVFQKWDSMNQWQQLLAKIGALTSALLSLAMASGVFHSIWTMGAATVGIIAGISAMLVAINTAKKDINDMKINTFANGGFPDEGQLFVANEKGPEMVGSLDGKTAVANNQMITKAIEEASYRGMSRALNSSDGNNNVTLNFNGLDGNAVARALFTPLIDEARRRGYEVKKA